MDRNTLQMIQRGLIAAVSLVLALIVITSFMDLIRPQEQAATTSTTTTEATEETVEETTTTTTLAAGGTTTTTDVATPAVCLEEEPEDSGQTVLRIFLPCGSNELATPGAFVYRTVAPTDLVLTATLSEMAKGVQDDEAELGFTTPFPDGANSSFAGVLISERTAYVTFLNDGIFPAEADTPEGSLVLLSTLNANVFQFSTIDAIEYRIGTSCEAFWQRLGVDECVEISRSDWQSQQVASP